MLLGFAELRDRHISRKAGLAAKTSETQQRYKTCTIGCKSMVDDMDIIALCDG